MDNQAAKSILRDRVIVAVAVVSLLLGLLIGKGRSKNQKPIELPQSELARLMNAKGGIGKTYSTLPIFTVSFINQSEWQIASLEIQLGKKGQGPFFTFVGEPWLNSVENGLAKVATIPPKTTGYFSFQIGNAIPWKTQTNYGQESYEFEAFDWSIVKAIGYRNY